MDRALDPDVVAEALGRHIPGALPTVEELIDLIANVEVRTFSGPADVDGELLRAGWYLHGVASASSAQDLYSPTRQERAFAVSAHIFDLALNERGRSTHERLTLAFAAQVGYRRASLDPNATAIWRRVDYLLDGASADPDVQGTEEADNVGVASSGADAFIPSPPATSARDLTTMALRAGVAFLGLDAARVAALLQVWRAEIATLTIAAELPSLRGTMFGPAEAVTLAVAALITFLRYGSVEELRSAQAKLRSVLDLSAGEGDHDARWVAAHLLSIAEGMETSSVWSVLPSGTPDVVAQAFTVGAPPVLTLWPPQRDLLRRPISNPLDPETKRLLLSVPTSAGKTLVAQLLICHHLATQPGNICYITPLRSLGREMRQALSGRLRVLQKGMGNDLPDFGEIGLADLFDVFTDSADASVDVMTPERLAHLLRRDPERVLGQYSMFVIDEAHLLAQPGRGFLLESLLAVLSTVDARLILLSGVMGNALQIASWLDPTTPDVLFSSAWRGPRRLNALLYSRVAWTSEERLPPRSRTFTHLSKYPMVADLRVRPAESRVHRLGTSLENPIGELVRSVRQDNTFKDERTPFYKLCARTAHALLPAGSLLMILSRRDYARNAAQEVAALLEQTGRTDELREFLAERLGEEHPLIDCVRHGVAYHHAGLPVDVLDALEQAMRSEVLLAMFATSTLTDGVNLPVRTVLICETRYEGQDPGQQLDAPRLLNAVGRAGRAGRETEGWIVLGLNQAHADSNFDILQPAADDLQIRSTLDSEHALHSLAEAEALIAKTADALFELAAGEAADFTTYVWFVLSAMERLSSLSSTVHLDQAIGGLLAFVQLPDEIRVRWLRLARHVEELFKRTPVASRLRWTITGTALRSAREIESIALQVTDLVASRRGALSPAGELVTHEPVSLTIDEALTVLQDAGAFERLLKLPEAGNPWRFKPSVGSHRSLNVPVAQSLREWLSGLDMPALAAAMLPEVPDVSWRIEQTVDAVSGTFEHFLSWTVGAVTAQANELLLERGALATLPDQLPHFIHYGVDTSTAMNLMMKGIRSRRIANAIGRRAQAEAIEWSRVRDWLRGLHLAGWRDAFGATPREIEDLAEFCRAPGKSPLRQLLEDGHATVSLAAPMANQPRPQPVELRVTSATDPIEAWTLFEPVHLVGIVSAAAHADMILLHGSGTEHAISADGATLSIRSTR